MSAHVQQSAAQLRRARFAATTAHTVQQLAAAAVYTPAALDFYRGGGAHAPTYRNVAVAVAAALSIACFAVAGLRLMRPPQLYASAARKGVAAALIHLLNFRLCELHYGVNPESASELNAYFLGGLALFALYSAANNYAVTFAATAARNREEFRPPVIPAHFPLHSVAESMPEGNFVFVPATALFYTGGGTLMIDGRTTAGNLLTDDRPVMLNKDGRGFYARANPEDLPAPPTLREHDIPEHAYVVTNQ